MTDVSDALRAARERAGLTIEDMSLRTKIKTTFLEAIERGEFERLPGEFFARAFVRTCARELQLSPDEMVAAYDARYGTTGHEQPVVHPPQRLVDRVHLSTGSFALPSVQRAWPTLAVAGAILVVLAIANRPTPDRIAEPKPVGTMGVAEGAAAADPEAARKAPERLTIEVQPSRTMWVAGMADGKRVIYRLVEPGERVRVDAKEDLWFRVGDAGAFVYSLNGSAPKPLGKPGEVREFTITRENYLALTR